MHNILKRDGRITNFKKEKITTAIHKAVLATSANDEKLSLKLTDEVVALIEERIQGIPTVEDVQNIVEEVLVGDVALVVEGIIRTTCKEMKIEIIDMAVNVDHVHLFIEYPPKYYCRVL